MNNIYSPTFQQTPFINTISAVSVKTRLIFNPVKRKVQLLKGRSSHMLLSSIIVIGLLFISMFPASIRMNLKHDWYLFKRMIDRVKLDNCIIVFRVIVRHYKLLMTETHLHLHLLKYPTHFYVYLFSCFSSSIELRINI